MSAHYDAKKRILKSMQALDLAPPGFKVWTQTFGEHRSRRFGQGIEFKEYRLYKPGEDISKRDINASKRIGKDVVRENITEEKMRNAIILDDSPSLQFHGLREVAFTAAGCYAISAVKDRDPVRVIRIGGQGVVRPSPPLFAQEEVVALVANLWDHPFTQATDALHSNTMVDFSRAVSHASSFRNTRIVFISDFAFSDANAVYDGEAKTVVFNGKDILRRAIGRIVTHPEASSLALVGISPRWKDFLRLHGFFRVTDVEDGKEAFVRFTRQSAREFVERQTQREGVWHKTARAINIPMQWLHVGESVPVMLTKASL